MSSERGFPDYITQTNESGVALYVFVIVYTSLSVFLIAPLVIWGRKHAQHDHDVLDEELVLENRATHGRDPTGLGQHPPRQEPPLNGTRPTANGTEATNIRPNRFEVQSERGATASRLVSEGEAYSEPVQKIRRVQRAQGGLLRHLDRYATSSYPDDNIDFVLSAISGGTARTRAQDSVARDQSSSTPSAATTSRLYRHTTHRQPSTQLLDVHGKRWKGRRPVGRANTIQRAIETETQIMISSAVRSQATQCSASGRVTPPVYRDNTSWVPSGGNRAVGGHISSRPRMSHRRRGGSFSSAESGSILPFVEDDITPNDAADAGDPGQQILFERDERQEVTVFCGPNALWKPPTMVKAIDDMADIANPDKEMKRIIVLDFPLTLGAISDSVFQTIIVAVVSHSIGTDSMAAFIIVSLFLGLTDDLVGAIADAEGALCSHAMSMGDMYLTGQYVQLAIGFHLIVFAAIMVIWVCYMDSLVEWLVDSPNIADVALSYSKIAIWQHLLQTLSRTVTVLFHLVGSENFETQVDFGEGLVTLVLVACFLPSFREVTLDSVGWIQLTTALAAFVFKTIHAITRAWPPLFWRGLTKDWACRVSMGCLVSVLVDTSFSRQCLNWLIHSQNAKAAKLLVTSSLPLFVGAFLEYGEVSIVPSSVYRFCTSTVLTKLYESLKCIVGALSHICRLSRLGRSRRLDSSWRHLESLGIDF